MTGNYFAHGFRRCERHDMNRDRCHNAATKLVGKLGETGLVERSWAYCETCATIALRREGHTVIEEANR